MRTPGPEAIRLIKLSEGLKLQAYQDTSGIWTIGYGHTSTAKSGKVIDQAMADALLETDALVAVQQVLKLVTVDLTQGQLDALTDFVYNLGSGSLKASTLLRKVNAKDWDGATKEFARWVYGKDAKGVKYVLPGLKVRRDREIQLFVEGSFE